MQDRTMSSALKLHIYFFQEIVWEYGVRKEFILNFSYSFWQMDLGIFQLSLTVGVVAAAVSGQEMRQ